eukprot:2360574-Rhodomonas_salina.1
MPTPGPGFVLSWPSGFPKVRMVGVTRTCMVSTETSLHCHTSLTKIVRLPVLCYALPLRRPLSTPSRSAGVSVSDRNLLAIVLGIPVVVDTHWAAPVCINVSTPMVQEWQQMGCKSRRFSVNTLSAKSIRTHAGLKRFDSW